MQAISNLDYLRITAEGVWVRKDGIDKLVSGLQVVLCAGQEPNNELLDTLTAAGKRVHLIGGARLAGELDAKRAIREAWELAGKI